MENTPLEQMEDTTLQSEILPVQQKSLFQKPLAVLGSILVFSILALGIYFFLRKDVSAPAIDTPTVSTASPTSRPTAYLVTPSPRPIPTSIPIKVEESAKKGWKRMEVQPFPDSLHKPYSMEFPDNWEFNQIYNGLTNAFTLSKKEHVIAIDQAEVGGALCIFSDTNLEEVDEIFKDNPVQTAIATITYEQSTLRRFKPSWMDTEGSTVLYRFCEITPKSNLYGAPTSIGRITYTVPKNESPDLLHEMDIILSTVKYLQ